MDVLVDLDRFLDQRRLILPGVTLMLPRLKFTVDEFNYSINVFWINRYSQEPMRHICLSVDHLILFNNNWVLLYYLLIFDQNFFFNLWLILVNDHKRVMTSSEYLLNFNLSKREQRNELFDSSFKMTELQCRPQGQFSTRCFSTTKDTAIFEQHKWVMAPCRYLLDFKLSLMLYCFNLN